MVECRKILPKITANESRSAALAQFIGLGYQPVAAYAA